MSKIATGGPPGKPTHLKLLEGNPGKQKINDKEPKPPPVSDISKPPNWMSPKAKKFWRKYAPILKRLGLLTEPDVPALSILCETFAEYRQALWKLRTEGFTTLAPSGYEQQRPEVGILRKARKDIESLLAHFGMTPAARTRIQVNLESDLDDPERILD